MSTLEKHIKLVTTEKTIYTLYLDQDELQVLVALTGSIFGRGKFRDIANKLYNQLKDHDRNAARVFINPVYLCNDVDETFNYYKD